MKGTQMNSFELGTERFEECDSGRSYNSHCDLFWSNGYESARAKNITIAHERNYPVHMRDTYIEFYEKDFCDGATCFSLELAVKGCGFAQVAKLLDHLFDDSDGILSDAVWGNPILFVTKIRMAIANGVKMTVDMEYAYGQCQVNIELYANPKSRKDGLLA
jgi:hypothetical protein